MVDLHLHSTVSDGTAHPAEVVQFAVKHGLRSIALTDHDTVDGVVDAVNEGGRLGVRVIAGSEISAKCPWGEVHVLAYCLAPEHPALRQFLSDQRAQRRVRAFEMIGRLNALGVTVDGEEVERVVGDSVFGRPHIARALVSNGSVANVAEAFARYLSDQGPAFVPRPLPSLDIVTQLVKDAGGVTSAAHLKEQGTVDNVRYLRDHGTDGLEVIHPSHNHRTTQRINNLAERFNMLKSGGSDWHGVGSGGRDTLGRVKVPDAWLTRIEAVASLRTVV